MASGNTEQETAETFQQKMRQTLLSGFRLVGLSLGAKLRLFNALSSVDGPVTSQELASIAKCKERYVREWLHHMVMCDIIDVDETGKNFTLPVHRRSALTDPSQSIPGFAPAFSALLTSHQEILKCFHEDGPNGIPLESVMPFFIERSDTNETNLVKCADFLKTQVPEVTDLLEHGARVLEVGCGEGFILNELASRFPKSTFVGIDLSRPLLDKAKLLLSSNGRTNVEVLCQDVIGLPDDWRNSFDFIFMRDVLHDLPHVSKTLEILYSVLKQGGLLSIFEIYLHENPYESKQNPQMKSLGQLAYSISIYFCLASSLHVPGSEGLGAGSGIENIIRLLEKAGFHVSEERKLIDYANLHLLSRK